MAHDKNDPTELADVPPAAYRRDNPLARARVWLPVVAVLAAGAYWGAEYLARGDVRYTPGPLATVHATWDNNCAVCHVDARPLGGNNWAAAATGQAHVADAQCQACHDGPAHHASEKPGDVPGCASCHREHHGRQVTLARTANAQCLSCHRDLSSHVQGSAARFDNVAGFGIGQHPEFRDPAKDPGTVAFNHQLHLSAGLSKAADTAVPFTLAQIAPADRERYQRWVQPGGALKLDCAACHQADARDAGASPAALAGLPQNAVKPARGDGAYMQPILFERHCAACHPLTINRTVKEEPLSGLATVRHRLQPKELEEVVRGYYTEQFLKGDLKVSPGFLKRPLPGKDPRRAAQQQAASAVIEKHVAIDRAILLGASTCQKCHPALGADPSHIAPAHIPQVWRQRAKFDHAAHRAVDCLQCHPGAPQSRVSGDILLPGIQTCSKCHAPSEQHGDTVRGGARFDCVECHRYHDGDHPLHGKGAAARQPAGGRTVDIETFLDPLR